MNDSPLMLLLMIGGGLYFASMWYGDWQSDRTGLGNHTAPLPGTTSASASAILIATGGALLLLAAETWGEIVLGLSEQQSDITLLFGLYTLVAALVEEVVFRGYLVVEKRGRTALLAGILGASLVFALLHNHLWRWDDEGFALTLTAKGWFSFSAIFLGSLWFYTCRFASWNPRRSLLPCFAAHFAKNAGVLAIKAIQGHVIGLW
ncbi:MAG: CPBP family intramembrane metalloprotease [Verrucomicrobia bacterium]|nr:CPBP family intramembrane metalloprotease [Verrucomicrobiota bacterium]